MAGSQRSPEARASMRRLARRSLRYFWSAHVAVVLGVFIGAASLTGALFVGDSMRGSLRDSALARLGRVEFGVIAPHFFRQQLGDVLATDLKNSGGEAAAMITLPVSAMNPESKALAGGVTLFGCNDGLWALNHWPGKVPVPGEVLVSAALAGELSVAAGNDVVLRLERPQTAPVDTLLGRRDELGQSLRLRVGRVVNDDAGGGFALRPAAGRGRTVFANLADLQKALKQPGRANAVVIGDTPGRKGELDEALAKFIQLDDVGLTVRRDTVEPAVVVESRQMLIPPGYEDAILAAAKELRADATRVIVYVVNEIGGGGTAVIPYSTACALDSTKGLALLGGGEAPMPGDGEVLLNEWAAEDLKCKAGDSVRIKYFASRPYGRLEEVESSLRLKGIVAMSGLGADAALTPSFEGITDTKRISDWNPPFPMDMKRIRPKDEAYWDKYKAAPKAFVSLATGLKLWAEAEPRYGRLTSVRLRPGGGMSLNELQLKFGPALLKRLPAAGLAVQPLREQAVAAAGGSTDFGELFVGFSFFLILAAAMLVALLFQLHLERRGKEIGTLLALGWPMRTVRGLLMREAAAIAAVGSVMGVAGAFGFAWLMIWGLRHWWTGIGDAPPLALHASGLSCGIGVFSSFVIAMITLRLSLRRLAALSPVRLLSGEVISAGEAGRRTRARWVAAISGAGGLAVLGLSLVTRRIPEEAAFFAGGAMLLVGGVAGMRAMLGAASARAR